MPNKNLSIAPTQAQTFCQGPLEVNGSGKPLTKEELDACKTELEDLKAKHNLKEPVRSFMDDPDIKWRYGKPDYSLANLLYFKGRQKYHPEGSLENIVENLVKTWEMERSHKPDHTQHKSVDTDNFIISANDGKRYNNAEANVVGNYNVLLDSCPKHLWAGAESISNEESHEKFHKAFAAFPWEVIEVFSGPPLVGFTWRHWAHFTGTYEGHQGKGELVEMYGFATATVNESLQLVDVRVFYNAENFMKIMKGEMKAEEVQGGSDLTGPGCPFLALGGEGNGGGGGFLSSCFSRIAGGFLGK